MSGNLQNKKQDIVLRVTPCWNHQPRRVHTHGRPAGRHTSWTRLGPGVPCQGTSRRQTSRHSRARTRLAAHHGRHAHAAVLGQDRTGQDRTAGDHAEPSRHATQARAHACPAVAARRAPSMYAAAADISSNGWHACVETAASARFHGPRAKRFGHVSGAGRPIPTIACSGSTWAQLTLTID
jgi:hypothetical protein